MAAPSRSYASGIGGVPSAFIDATWTPGTPPFVGDLIVAIGVSASGAITTPSGWTLVDHTTQGSLHTHLWFREYVSGISGVNQVFTGPSGRYSIYVLGYTGAAIDLATYAATADGSAAAYPVNVVAPSIAGAVDSVLVASYNWRDGTLPTASTPSGMASAISGSNNGIVNDSTFEETLGSGGATGTRTSSVSASTGSYIESIAYSFLVSAPVTFPLRLFPRNDDLDGPRLPQFHDSAERSPRLGGTTYE